MKKSLMINYNIHLSQHSWADETQNYLAKYPSQNPICARTPDGTGDGFCCGVAKEQMKRSTSEPSVSSATGKAWYEREKLIQSRLEVGGGGTSRRRVVGRRSSLPPTEGRAEGRRSKVEGRRSKVEVEVRGSKSEGRCQMIKTYSWSLFKVEAQ